MAAAEPTGSPALLLEPLWRGSVHRWECDENDHLNVRFHFAHASEAVAFLLATRFGIHTPPRCIAQHARFSAEARVATPLLAQGSVAAVSADSVTVYVELVHGLTGAVHSTFASELELSARALGEACALASQALPAHGARRGLPIPIRRDALPTLTDAQQLNTVEIGRGVIAPDECAHGHTTPSACVGRVSNGILRLLAHVHGDDAVRGRQEGRMGGAVVEYDLVYPGPVPAGTPFVVRSGIAALDGRVQRFAHWMFDARTGAMICASNAVAIALDLVTRKAASFSEEQRRLIESRCDPALAL